MIKDKTINLYLDDLRDCPEGFIVARNMTEAVQLFKKYNVNILSLDHDLGEDENKNLLESGYDFVKYFCENGLYANAIYIHTDNPVGRENMYKTLLGARERQFISASIKIFRYNYCDNKYSG